MKIPTMSGYGAVGPSSLRKIAMVQKPGNRYHLGSIPLLGGPMALTVITPSEYEIYSHLGQVRTLPFGKPGVTFSQFTWTLDAPALSKMPTPSSIFMTPKCRMKRRENFFYLEKPGMDNGILMNTLSSRSDKS